MHFIEVQTMNRVISLFSVSCRESTKRQLFSGVDADNRSL